MRSHEVDVRKKVKKRANEQTTSLIILAGFQDGAQSGIILALGYIFSKQQVEWRD
jgi:hypothetical protein